LEGEGFGNGYTPRLIRMKVNFIVTIRNGRRIPPTMEALIRLTRIVTLLNNLESLKPLPRLETIACVRVVTDGILLEPMLNGQLLWNSCGTTTLRVLDICLRSRPVDSRDLFL
jgi:hypothetical protein